MNQEYWEKARHFHGHECPGLAIGVKVCEAAIEKLGIKPSLDEEIVCVAENDACGVDAVQALLGCTIGKGNLIYKGTGKQAFTFINRATNQAMRFYLKERNNGRERQQYQDYLLNAAADQLFTCTEVEANLPEYARIFTSLPCQICGEVAPEHKMRVQEGKTVCLDCFKDYTRGW